MLSVGACLRVRSLSGSDGILYSTCFSDPVATARGCDATSKFGPIIGTWRHKAVPMTFKTGRQAAHYFVERSFVSDRQQVITIGLVLRETDDFSIAKFTQQSDVGLADRPAQIAGAR